MAIGAGARAAETRVLVVECVDGLTATRAPLAAEAPRPRDRVEVALDVERVMGLAERRRSPAGDGGAVGRPAGKLGRPRASGTS